MLGGISRLRRRTIQSLSLYKFDVILADKLKPFIEDNDFDILPVPCPHLAIFCSIFDETFRLAHCAGTKHDRKPMSSAACN